MIRKYYIENINEILNNGIIEKQKLENTKLLKEILFDKKLGKRIYQQFKNNYETIGEDNMLYTKTQDLVYRLNYAINKWLIPMQKINDSEKIKVIIEQLVENDVDLYSAVSYDESDKEMIEEFNYLLDDKKFKI